MSRIAWTVFAFAWAVTAQAQGEAAPAPAPGEFAWRFAIQTPHTRPVQRIALPEEVYASQARGDLADLRVFNAEGEAVEHAIVPAQLPAAHARAPVPLRLFPLRGPQAARGNSLTITVDAAGALIDLQDRQASGKRVDAYLIDAGGAQHEMAALRLAWGDDAAEFVAPVTLESSPDLRAWREVGTATLANLTHAGQRLGQHEIALQRSADRYLRMHWTAGAETPGLIAAEAILKPEVPAQSRHWRRIEAAPPAAGSRGWEFDAGAWLPVDRVRAVFAEANSMATLRLWSRADAKDPWRERGSALFYRLQADGTELRGEDLALDTRRDRYWRVEAHEPLARAPVLELGWTPDELVFVARGRTPFHLAVGNANVAAAARPVGQLLANFDAREREALTGVATLGPRTVVAGPEALVPAPPPVPWQRYLLWAVLVGGVLVLLGMAVQLYRQMNTTRGRA